MARFTLLDDAYYDAILRVTQALAEHEVRACLVGGGASQLWIASLVSGAGERRVANEPALAVMLRATRDADFSLRCDAAQALALLNELASEHRGGGAAHVLGPRAMRLGPVQVSLTLGPEDLTGMADRYDWFLDSQETVRVRRGREPDAVPVIGLEALIATKLTRRGDKSKDLVDAGNLVAAARRAGRPVDPTIVASYLGEDAAAEAMLAALLRHEEEEE